jgi:uncharacterized protein YbaR (Trm112 family)
MNIMNLYDLAERLVCPMCRNGDLSVISDYSGLRCRVCSQSYLTDYGVVSFLIPEQLNETNINEIKAYDFQGDITELTPKEEWSNLNTLQMKWVAKVVDQMLPKAEELYTLGAGTGFDLRFLLQRRSFKRIFASDISPIATMLIKPALSDYNGHLGLFASEFGRCPVPKQSGVAGLVFQALHHTPDSHAALATLLDHNFDDLVIVEPVTNLPLGFLARLGLVQRVEYSGTRPDWLFLPRVEALASDRGYKVVSRTWWEIPAYLSPVWLNNYPKLCCSFYHLVEKISVFTNLIRFGSMAAVHLARK